MEALVATGETERAEALARTLALSWERRRADQILILTLASRGEFDRAEDFVLAIGDEENQAEAGRELVNAAITHGAYDRARRLLDTFPSLRLRAQLLASLSRAAALSGAWHRTGVLATSLQDLTLMYPGVDSRDAVARYAAEALAWDRRFDTAEELARSIANPYGRGEALAILVEAAARSGEPGLAAVWTYRALETGLGDVAGQPAA